MVFLWFADKDLSFWTGPGQALDLWTCPNHVFSLHVQGGPAPPHRLGGAGGGGGTAKSPRLAVPAPPNWRYR